MHALPPRVALVPNAIAFRDPAHGVLGGGFAGSARGTVQLTSDGGRTWRVVLRAPEAVVAVGYVDRGAIEAVLADGAHRISTDGGRRWRPELVGAGGSGESPCPPSLPTVHVSGDVALCTGQGGAGSMSKAVYRLTGSGWRRVAYAFFVPPHAKGGISGYGYPLGITMASGGFGIIWESRGTLYVTHDGGSHWTGLPKVAVPELDFGWSAAALRRGIGFVLLARTGAPTTQRLTTHWRLLETTDAGRTWQVVHRWP